MLKNGLRLCNQEVKLSFMEGGNLFFCCEWVERKKREKTHLEAKWQSKRPHIIGIGSLLLLLLNHDDSLHGESVTNLTTTRELVRIVSDPLMSISNMVCCSTTLISVRIKWSSICVMVMDMGLFN